MLPSLRVVSLLVLAVVLTAGPSVSQSNRFNPSRMDTTCKPCDDFYKFVNGNWLKDNPVPAAYSRWGTFNILADENTNVLRDILENVSPTAPAGSNEQMIGSFYASCMDESHIETQGIAPIAGELERIDRIGGVQDLPGEIARLHNSGVSAAFVFGAAQDLKDSAQTIGSARQGGLTLPNKDFYTKTDDKSAKTRTDLAAHITRMLVLAGDSQDKAAAEAASILHLESQLADISMDPVELRDPVARDNKRSLAQLRAMTPAFSWTEYFTARGIKAPVQVNVAQPKFFEGLNGLLSSVPLADWKADLRWQVLHEAAPRLSSRFVDEDFNFFSRTLNGTTALLPRWKRCVQQTDRRLGDALGQVYVAREFPPESKARMDTLIGNLESAFQERIQGLDWMTDTTKKQALAKLDAFTHKIGYPSKWKDYTSLHIARDAYFDNARQTSALEVKWDLEKIDKPTDRTEWTMTPPTVNAYYRPANNEIVFPAGILQPPFFDPKADDALNYGAIGAVIGHEMSHGFDDSGSQYDPQGNLRNWWTADDRNKFTTRADCIVEQFSGYQTTDGLPLNGKLVLGESIGDLGGLTIAYRALQKSMEGKPRPEKIDGFTPEQRFFIGWAVVFASNQRPEAERQSALTDPHALDRYRVNGPLSNMEEFAQAFMCKKGDAMVRDNNRRCQVW